MTDKSEIAPLDAGYKPNHRDNSSAAPADAAAERVVPFQAKGTTPLAHDTTVAVAHLKALDALGRHNLVAINPTSGKLVGLTFEPGDWAGMAQWIEKRATHNIYYSVNEPRPEAPNSKLCKTDIANIRAVWVECDPDKAVEIAGKGAEERARLHKLADDCRADPVCPPSLALDSGGGIQMLWLIDKQPVAELQEHVEEINRGLVARYGGDKSATNLDRILRLPGTVNWPDGKKIKRRRVPRQSQFLHVNAERHYTLEQIAEWTPPVEEQRQKTETGGQQKGTAEDLPRKGTAEDLPRIEAALSYIDPTERETWLHTGMALKDHLGEDGRRVWDHWSTRSIAYDAGDQTYTWKSFKGKPNGITIGTLYFMARQAGWTDSSGFRDETKSENTDRGRGWRGEMLVTATGQPRPLIANALMALRNAPEWEGVLGYDEFALATMLLKPPPWLKRLDNCWTPQRWTDRDDALTADWLQHQGIGIPVSVAATAAETVARDAPFHPVRDYLNGLQWDGTRRIALFAGNYLGAEPTQYHASVSKCMFIAGVARIMRPGCKADYMPIFEGAQGEGKSSAIDRLFAPWFSDDLAELGTKDAAMQVRVAWGIEIAELASMTRGDIERVKAFITRRVDRFRPSYGRHVIEVPRQSVFWGSTNSDTYLKDETGGRRFWPIRCGKIDLKAIERDRDQVWAEAVVLFKEGEPWWMTDAEIISLAHEEQAARYQEDAWQAAIAEYLTDKTDVTLGDILSGALHIMTADWNQADQNRVARCLRNMQWERYRGQRPQREWRYRRDRIGSGPSLHRGHV